MKFLDLQGLAQVRDWVLGKAKIQKAETFESLPTSGVKLWEKRIVKQAHVVYMDEYETDLYAENYWRSFTAAEIKHILSQRTNWASLYGFATVYNVRGLLILPDDWTVPSSEIVITPNTRNYSDNIFSAEQWSMMESAGAVFLPDTYFIADNNTHVSNSPKRHYYLTGSHMDYRSAWGIFWQDSAAGSNTVSSFKPNDDWYFNHAGSVRLVREVPSTELHSFQYGTTYLKFAKGNLQYKSSLKKWRIAPTQYHVTPVADDLARSANSERWFDQFTYASNGQSIKPYQWNASVSGWHNTGTISGTSKDWGANKIDGIKNKGVVYPANTTFTWNGSEWIPMGGYQNGNLLSNAEYLKLKGVDLSPITTSIAELNALANKNKCAINALALGCAGDFESAQVTCNSFIGGEHPMLINNFDDLWSAITYIYTGIPITNER